MAMNKKFIELDVDVLEKIFLLLTVDEIHTCTQVSEEWEEFIRSHIYSQTKVKNLRIERNWSQVDPRYDVSSDFLHVNLDKPFVIKATDKFVVAQEYNNMHVNQQQFRVYNLDTNDVWTTPTIGPTMPVEVPRYQRLWKDYIRVQVFINQDVMAVIFANREKKGYHKLIVWSSVSHRKVYEASMGNYCGALFYEEKSVLVVFQVNKLEVLMFSDKAFLSRHSCVNEINLKKPKVAEADNYNISSPYLLFWQSTVSETRLFMWKYHDLEMELKHYKAYLTFKRFANIDSDNHLKDALYVSNHFLLLTHTHVLPRGTTLKVLNENGIILKQIVLGRYLANSGLLYNDRKLFVKAFRFVYEELMMFDFKELIQDPLDGREVFHKEMDDLRLRNMAYHYYQHYHPEGGRESGFVVNKHFLAKAAVVTDDGKMKIVMKKLDFSALD